MEQIERRGRRELVMNDSLIFVVLLFRNRYAELSIFQNRRINQTNDVVRMRACGDLLGRFAEAASCFGNGLPSCCVYLPNSLFSFQLLPGTVRELRTEMERKQCCCHLPVHDESCMPRRTSGQ